MPNILLVDKGIINQGWTNKKQGKAQAKYLIPLDKSSLLVAILLDLKLDSIMLKLIIAYSAILRLITEPIIINCFSNASIFF